MTQPLEDAPSPAPSTDEEMRVVVEVAGSVVFNDEEQRQFARSLLSFGLDRYNRRRRKPVAPEPEARDASADTRKRGRRAPVSPASFPHFAIICIWAFARWGNQNTGIADHLVTLVTNELSFRRPMDGFFRRSEHEGKWHDTLHELVESTTLTPLGEDLSNRVRSRNSVYHFLREYRTALESSQLPERTKKRSIAVLAGVISGAIAYLFSRVPKAIAGTSRSALSTTMGKIVGLLLFGLGVWVAYSLICGPRSEQPIVSTQGPHEKDGHGERSRKGARPLPPLVVTNSSAPGSQPAQIAESTRTLPVRRRGLGLGACDLESLADEVLGPDAIDCGEMGDGASSPNAIRARACAISAYQSGREFLLVARHKGIDFGRDRAFIARRAGDGINIEQYVRDARTATGSIVGANVFRTSCLVYPSHAADCLRDDFCIDCNSGNKEQICERGERM